MPLWMIKWFPGFGPFPEKSDLNLTFLQRDASSENNFAFIFDHKKWFPFQQATGRKDRIIHLGERSIGIKLKKNPTCECQWHTIFNRNCISRWKSCPQTENFDACGGQFPNYHFIKPNFRRLRRAFAFVNCNLRCTKNLYNEAPAQREKPAPCNDFLPGNLIYCRVGR